MANDIITHLDEEPVQRLTLNRAVEKMRGPENSKIKLKIMRKGQDKSVEVTITRARIQVRSVRSRLEGDDVGFIRVTQFNEQAAGDLKKAITDLSTQAGDKLKSFIIDLRNNPGGLLDQAISVSDAFLEKGEIVSTRGRSADETQRFNARAGEDTRASHVRVWVTQEVGLLGRTQLTKSPLGAPVPRGLERRLLRLSRLHPSRLSKRLPRACRPVSANRSTRDQHSKVRSGLIHPPNRGQPTPSSG
jgi:Peptidase family S41